MRLIFFRIYGMMGEEKTEKRGYGMLIDFHTHVFPDKLAPHAVEALTAGIYAQQGADYGNGQPLNVCMPTVSGLTALMQRAGVDRSVCLSVATNVHQQSAVNRFAYTVAQYGKAHGNVLYAFGAVHPLAPDWAEQLDTIARIGLSGVKLHPQFQETDFDAPEMLRLLRRAGELHLPVIFHAGEDIGLPPPTRTTPQKIRNVLDRIGGCTLIAAHLGGWQMWDDVERYLVGTPVYLDTAFISRFLPQEQCLRIIRAHGADRILFGSDAPWENPADTLQYLRTMPLTDAEFAKITHRNALRLLGEDPSDD